MAPLLSAKSSPSLRLVVATFGRFRHSRFNSICAGGMDDHCRGESPPFDTLSTLGHVHLPLISGVMPGFDD